MDNVKKTLQQYSGFISDETVIDELKQLKRKTNSGEIETVFSQRASEFLEKYELRKLNLLVELSAMSLASA